MRRRLTSLGLLAFLGLGTMAFAQVTGVVNDGNNFPESDVEVTVKGTDKVAYTDENGNFNIDAKVGDTLIINGKEFKVTSTNLGALKYATESKDISLSTVTIIGGIKLDPTQKVGSYAVVKKEDFENTPVASIDEVLNGRVAGLNFSTNGGQPGSSNIVAIRGVGSFVGSTNPLYVIDGVVVGKGSDNSSLTSSFNPLSSIDPNQIESVTVLKDASSTALYGARGANGVVVVTTKRGKYQQPTKINLSTESAFQSVAFDRMDFMDANEFLEWGGLTRFNTGKFASREEANLYFRNTDMKYDGVSNTDWRDEIQRGTSTVNNYNFAISGGGENTSFRAGLSYYQNRPLVISSKFDRYSASFAVDHKASDKFKIGFTGNVSSVENRTYSQGGSTSNPWLTQWTMLPIYPVYNTDGSYNLNLGSGKTFNAVALQKENFVKGSIQTFVGALTASYDLTKELSFSSLYGAQYQIINEKKWWNPNFGDGLGYQGLLQDSFRNAFDWNWTNTLTYRKTFSDIHQLEVNVGMDYQEHSSVWKYQVGSKIDRPWMNAATDFSLGQQGDRRKWVQFSYFGRLSYTIAQKYSLTGNIRRDANSTLGADNRDGIFWSTGASWNIGKEEFLKGSGIDLILRANYGETGNIPYADSWGAVYNGITKYGIPTESVYGDQPATNITAAGNPKLKWEVSKQFNIGLDFGIKNNLVSGSIDVYNRKTSDAIFPSVILGETPSYPNSYMDNIGEIINKGIEATLAVKPFDREFKWALNANFSYNKSEVGNLVDPNARYMEGNMKAIQQGHVFGEYYTYGWAGVDSSNGDPLWYTDETKSATTNDITKATRYYQGKTPFPKYMAGLRSDMSYKGFTLSAFFAGQFEYSVYDAWQNYSMGDGSTITRNQQSQMLYDSWTPTNTNASNPRQVIGGVNSTGAASGSQNPSTRWLRDGDHIRLKEIKLAYSFKDKIKAVENLTIYVKGNNIWTYAFDKNLDFDPESNSNRSTYQWQGKGVFDYTSPIMKSYSLGLSIDF
ncbi:SusC/RagA family TonB-linked outer membrane protein [Empedobacter falsenii]